MQAVKEQGFETKVDFAYDAKDEIGDLLRIYRIDDATNLKCHLIDNNNLFQMHHMN